MKSDYGVLPTFEDEQSILTEKDVSILQSITLSVEGNENEKLMKSEYHGSNSTEEMVVQKESELLITEDTPTYDRMWIFSAQSLPVTCSFVISIATTFITQYFAGRFEYNGNKSIVFAGIALAVTFYNVTCRSLLIGLTSAVDTLASQNNGSGNYREVGLVVQRCIVICSLCCIPMMPVWLQAEEIFSYLPIDKEVTIVIGVFIRARLAGLPADIVSESYEKYLMAVGEMSIPMYSNIIIGAVIVVLNVVLINMQGFGYEVLAWTVVISEYAGVASQLGLSWYCKSVQRTLQPWSMDLFNDWGTFMSLALPGVGMLCSEWWAFEILTIFSSLISTEAVAAQAVIIQLSTIAYMVPLGFSITGTSLIGNSLGACKKELAIDITKLGYVLVLFLELVMCVVIFTLGDTFVRVFALDEQVRHTAYSIMPFLALFTLSDGVQCFSSGVLRGAGKQDIGALVNIFTYYTVGLPCAWYFCFHTVLGVRGLMCGISVAVVIQNITFLAYIFGYQDTLFVSITGTLDEEAFSSMMKAENDREKNDAAAGECSTNSSADSPVGVYNALVPSPSIPKSSGDIELGKV